MYLYDNLQKFITLDKYNVQKGPHHITAINYIDRQQTPSATAIAIAIAAQGVQSLTHFIVTSSTARSKIQIYSNPNSGIVYISPVLTYFAMILGLILLFTISSA